MKTKILSLILSLFVLCSLLCVTAVAEETVADSPLLVDQADLLSVSEESAVITKLGAISDKYNVDVAIVTVDGLGGSTVEAMAEYLYGELEYGFGSDKSGVMMLISLDGIERDWAVHVHGVGEDAIGDSEMQSIMDAVLPYLSNDNFYSAFNTFADECDYYINGEINGFPFKFARNLIIALVIGFIVAFIATSVMKGKLKSVRFQNQAANYVKDGSMNVTVSRDFFLYRNITRTARPKNNSSSSGRSSGGGRTYSGKF